MGIGGPELLVAFVLSLLVPLVLLAVGYWVVRLAVRHGTLDAHQRLAVRPPVDEGLQRR